MAHELDRLLFWKNRAERLEADLSQTHPAMHGLIRAKLESAKRAEHAAFAILVSAAHSGDPEAIVALDALECEKRATWAGTRSARECVLRADDLRPRFYNMGPHSPH